jgi:HD-GYP domain-containing protein (c-di-GMP phosphodiesterase class II)
VLLAEELAMDRAEIQHLIKGAALHDVGKIAIRDDILLKPGKLTEVEYEEMKSHVAHGVDIVSRSSWLEPAKVVVHNHHERFGGGGYLHGLTGTDIPLSARVFAIVDVFDALASVRPYKEALGFERTMEIMRGDSGTHFDPEILAAFERIAPEIYRRYYRSSTAELESELDRLVDRYFSGGLDALEVV